MPAPAKPIPPLTDEQRALVERHLYLVGYVLRLLRDPASVDKAEIESCGYYALCVAAAQWTPEGGASYRTLAFSRIKWAIHEMIRKSPTGTRPHHRHRDVSLSTCIATRNGGEGDLLLEDVLPGDDDETVREEARRRQVMAAIEALPERMQVVIRGRLAGDGFREIGTRLGVTDSRAKQIEHQALRELQRALRYWGAPQPPPSRGWHRPREKALGKLPQGQ